MGSSAEVDLLPFRDLPVHYAACKDPANPSLWRLADPQTRTPLLMREYTLNDSGSLNTLIDSLKSKLPLQHENYLPLERLFCQSHKGLCSESYRLGAVFKATDLTLAEEVASRKAERKPFEERELWSIMCSCVLGLLFL
jgi:hypothetical protein